LIAHALDMFVVQGFLHFLKHRQIQHSLGSRNNPSPFSIPNIIRSGKMGAFPSYQGDLVLRCDLHCECLFSNMLG
jgi:hypothetical protein